MDENMIIISARLKAIRKEHKLTQQAFADKFGISQSSYSGYESGTIAPTLFFLIQVAKEYNISMDYLTGISKGKEGLVEDELSNMFTDMIINPCKQEGASKLEMMEGVYLGFQEQIRELKNQMKDFKKMIDEERQKETG